MIDEETQKLRRQAESGDEAAKARLERIESRFGESIRSFLEGLIGKLVFIEGIRINYRGILKRIIVDGNGMPSALIFDRLQRISYMSQSTAENSYVFKHAKERLVPWDVVHDIGEESFLGIPKWDNP